MTKILLVDDEPTVVGFLDRLFLDSGYQTIRAFDGMTALKEFFTERPDIVVMDLLMPEMNGFELCRRIRDVSCIPVIVLTGLDQVGEKVNAFKAGADDYIVKPVSGREVLARAQACLRRAQWPPSAEVTFVYSDAHLTVDFAQREVCIDGEPRELTSTEYTLLTLFVQRPKEALSLEFLMTTVWGREYDTFGLIKWHVSNLRKKLKHKSDQSGGKESCPIVTVRGYGYRYVPAESAAPNRTGLEYAAA